MMVVEDEASAEAGIMVLSQIFTGLLLDSGGSRPIRQ